MLWWTIAKLGKKKVSLHVWLVLAASPAHVSMQNFRPMCLFLGVSHEVHRFCCFLNWLSFPVLWHTEFKIIFCLQKLYQSSVPAPKARWDVLRDEGLGFSPASSVWDAGLCCTAQSSWRASLADLGIYLGLDQPGSTFRDTSACHQCSVPVPFAAHRVGNMAWVFPRSAAPFLSLAAAVAVSVNWCRSVCVKLNVLNAGLCQP